MADSDRGADHGGGRSRAVTARARRYAESVKSTRRARVQSRSQRSSLGTPQVGARPVTIGTTRGSPGSAALGTDRVRAGAEVDASPRLAILVNLIYGKVN